VLYRSLFPSDGVHGYFGWYEPAVAAVSLASALVVGVAAVAALLGRRSRALAGLRTTPPTAMSGVRLAALGVGWLVVQETIERSLSAGGFQLATFDIGGWAIIVGATIVAAGVLTLFARIGVALVRAVASAPSRRFARSQAVVRWIASIPPRRRRPLADRRGLRAPPAAV
jgi:hypothetical protein